uniref:Extensin-like n=1 Tax=Mesocestoides corti TaxID=53468 RepID=A0A5K3FW00_MESCO
MTSKPHSAQWCDLPPGDFHLCHFFETPKAGEFAERLLNLQLTLLATMNEEGDSPEKACIIANIMRSSEWNASTASPPPPMPVPAVLPQSESPPRGPSPFQPPTPQPSEPSQQPVPATNEPVDSKTATQELLVELATGPEPQVLSTKLPHAQCGRLHGASLTAFCPLQVHPPPPPHSPPAAAAAVSADEPPLDAAAAAAPPVEVQPPDTNPSSVSQLSCKLSSGV